MNNEFFTLLDEEGNTIAGEEILRLDFSEMDTDLDDDYVVSVIQGEDGNLYQFIIDDDETALPIRDEKLLEYVSDALNTIFSESEDEIEQ